MPNITLATPWYCAVELSLYPPGSPDSIVTLGSSRDRQSCGKTDLNTQPHWRPAADVFLWWAGIIGGNGSGKSTLFRMIMGQEQPDSGEIVMGQTVVPMYSEQSREGLNDDKTVRRDPFNHEGLH